MSLHMS